MNLSADSLIRPYTLHKTIYEDGLKTLQVRRSHSAERTVSQWHCKYVIYYYYFYYYFKSKNKHPLNNKLVFTSFELLN